MSEDSARDAPKPRVLLVEDDEAILHGMSQFLRSAFEISQATSVRDAKDAVSRVTPDAAVLDFSLGDGTALDVLRVFREQEQDIPSIVLTGFGTIESAVAAIKEGAENYLTKPVELQALSTILTRLVGGRRLRARSEADARRLDRPELDPFMGTSRGIRELRDAVFRIAPTRAPLLISGETGTGKTLLARFIHAHSPRSSAPFVEVNCAGLPRELLESELFGHERGAFTGAHASKKGLFEVAHGGTLFLDEIGDLSLDLQPRVLKLFEDKTFRRLGAVQDRFADVRLIAATHQDLEAKVRSGLFREDLLFRLNAFTLRLPPLRAREEDMNAIVEHMTVQLHHELGLDCAALGASGWWRGYAWPGNFRELKNAIERSLILGVPDSGRRAPSMIDPEAVKVETQEAHSSLEMAERRHVEEVVKKHAGDIDRAASALGVSRSALYKRLQKYKAQSR